MSSLDSIQNRFNEALQDVHTLGDLDQLRVHYLGKKGEVKALLKKTGSLPPEERAGWGQQVNDLKNALLGAIESKKNALDQAKEEAALAAGWLEAGLDGWPLVGGTGRKPRKTSKIAEKNNGFCGFRRAKRTTQ